MGCAMREGGDKEDVFEKRLELKRLILWEAGDIKSRRCWGRQITGSWPDRDAGCLWLWLRSSALQRHEQQPTNLN
jgi:hypothetical protein